MLPLFVAQAEISCQRSHRKSEGVPTSSSRFICSPSRHLLSNHCVLGLRPQVRTQFSALACQCACARVFVLFCFLWKENKPKAITRHLVFLRSPFFWVWASPGTTVMPRPTPFPGECHTKWHRRPGPRGHHWAPSIRSKVGPALSRLAASPGDLLVVLGPPTVGYVVLYEEPILPQRKRQAPT